MSIQFAFQSARRFFRPGSVVRILTIVALILVWGALSADPSGQSIAASIPGIDDIPGAQYPEGDPRRNSVRDERTNPGTDNTTTTETNTDTETTGDVRARLPLIRNLKIERYPDIPFSVKITWDVDPSNTTAIYVARFIRPIDTREILLEADNITSPPLGPKETSFIDHKIPDGAYYYAVVTSYEVGERNNMVLKGGDNFTTDPLIIYRPEEENVNTGDETDNEQIDSRVEAYMAGDLLAVNSTDAVKLNWRGATARNIAYNVYRSHEPFKNETSLEIARLVGRTEGNTPFVEDRNPIIGRKVYYAVTVVDKRTDREYLQFVLNANYIAHTYERPQVSQDEERQIPEALTVYIENRNTIKLLWVDPEAEFSDLRVYRYDRPILNERSLRSARFVGWVKPGENTFRDTNLDPGIYYYAVLPRNLQGEEIRTFVEGYTFTGFGTRIEAVTDNTDTTENTDTTDTIDTGDNTEQAEEEAQNLGEPVLATLEAEGKTDSVDLKWVIAGEELERNLRQLVYRSKLPMRSFEQVRNRGDLLAELPGNRRTYTDAGLEAGKYYYAVILDVDGKIQEGLKSGRNYLEEPVTVGSRPDTETDTQTEDNKRHHLAHRWKFWTLLTTECTLKLWSFIPDSTGNR